MSFQAYPAYKDSAVPWLGDVPVHWELSRIGSRFTERREKVSDTDFPPLSVTKNGIVPQLETAAKTDDNDNRKGVRVGDFVINSRSDRKGSSGLSSLDGSVSLINTVIRPDDTMHGAFVHHLLRSVAFQEEYYRYGKGIVADLWSTNYGEMKAITLAVPPRGEQVAIAAFLDREIAKIDALVAEQERLIALLKEKRQAVISHAVTKGLNPHAPMKDSGIEWLGEIPAHWSVRPIRKLGTLESGHTPSKSRPEFWVEQECTIPWVTTGDVKQLRDGRTTHLHTTAVKISSLGLANSSARLLPKDTVFLSRTASVGFSGIMADDMAVSQDFAAWVCGDELLPAYLLFCLRSMSSVFASLMIGSTHKTIYMPDIEALVIPQPPVEEQQRIIDFILNGKVASEDLLDSCQAAITLLHERRAALISAAVTGKIDVRGLVDQQELEAA